MKKHLQRLLALVLAITMVTLMAPMAFAATISRGEFIAEITKFFGWPHYDEYHDFWKDDQKTFSDIRGHQFQRAIETALEEGVVGPRDRPGVTTVTDERGVLPTALDVVGAFNPNGNLTREDAAIMLARAYKLDISNIAHGFGDDGAFSGNEARGSVKALADLGLFGAVAGNFNPAAAIDNTEALNLFTAMKNGVAAPVYFVPRPTTRYAARRNIRLYTANSEAEIYVSRNLNGALNSAIGGRAEPADVVKSADVRYSEYHNTDNDSMRGFLGYDIGNTTGLNNERKYPVVKAIAVDTSKTLKPESAQTRAEWNLFRPARSPFDHELIFAKGELGVNSPAVYRLFHRSDGVQAMAWYIEGSQYAVVNDALNQNRANTDAGNYLNLRDYVLTYLANPTIKADPVRRLHLVVGHDNGDHTAQVYAFADAGHLVYGSRRYNPSAVPPNQLIHAVNGDTIDLGDSVLTVYELPGHSATSIILQDKVSGMIFGSDVYGCTRAGSVDDVGISNLRSDLFLSIIQQIHAMMRKDGGTTWVSTGHNEDLLPGSYLDIFEEVFQLIVDRPMTEISHPTYRQVRAGANARSVTLGSTYPNPPDGKFPAPIGTNMAITQMPAVGEATPVWPLPDFRQYRGRSQWITIQLGNTPPLSSPQPWNNVELNYNTTGSGAYSQLSNIQFEGAELVGVDVLFASGDINALHNMFDPWTYDYTIKVPHGTKSIKVIATPFSTKATSLRLNGKEVARKSENVVNVSDGTVITIDVVAGDGVTASKYTFTVSKNETKLETILEGCNTGLFFFPLLAAIGILSLVIRKKR